VTLRVGGTSMRRFSSAKISLGMPAPSDPRNPSRRPSACLDEVREREAAKISNKSCEDP
jgi:hypothetical protein